MLGSGETSVNRSTVIGPGVVSIQMLVRNPAIPLEAAPLLWSEIPEFSMTYDGASAVIPYVEYFLNATINKVRADFTSDRPALKEELTIFIKQETFHSQFHHRFNKRLYELIPEL